MPNTRSSTLRLTSRGLALLSLALLLPACASSIPPSLARPPLPADLIAPCPDLLPLADGSAAAVERKLVAVGQSYYDCADKHAALVQAVKEPTSLP